jgi:hypothetical protein
MDVAFARSKRALFNQKVCAMSTRSSLFIVTVVLSLAVPCRAAETFDSLARRVPGEANALVLIDVEQVLAAPMAQSQGWARKLEAAYVERPVLLPPEAKKLVLSAALVPSDDFLGAWELAVMELAEPIGVRAIARSEGGYVDLINGQNAAVTPHDAAFVDLGDNVLAAVRPADRQFISRWISKARASTATELSPYLESSLRLVNDRVQVLLAIDLTDVLAPRDIEAKLAEATWLAGGQADAAAIAGILDTLRGAALRLAIGADCQAQLQIDFDADVAPLGDNAQAIVLHALENLGFQTTEIAEWKVELDGKSILLRGPLSTAGQRRVFSVIELPAADLAAAESSADAEASPGDATPESEIRERSLVYFQSTQVLVDDLRKGLKDTKATSAFMERYARRIDDLPVLHVDELLLDYGDKLAETLRIMATSKRQAGISYGVRAGAGGDGGGYYDGYYYGEDAYDRAAERSQARKEEMAVAQDIRVQGWQLIDDATADIRRTLTQKYGVEF